MSGTARGDNGATTAGDGNNSAIVIMAGAAIVSLLAVISWSTVANHRKKKQVVAALVRVDQALEPRIAGTARATMDAVQLEELSEALRVFLTMVKQAQYGNIQIQMPEDRRAALVGFCDALAGFNANLASELASAVPVPALKAREGAPVDVLSMISEQLAYRNALLSQGGASAGPPELGDPPSPQEA